jgi:hypothetical protein
MWRIDGERWEWLSRASVEAARGASVVVVVVVLESAPRILSLSSPKVCENVVWSGFRGGLLVASTPNFFFGGGALGAALKVVGPEDEAEAEALLALA